MSTHGFYCNLNNKITENENTVKNLIDKGVLILCRGNVPQGLFSMESFNHIFGEAKNPYDMSRVPGGSSGGEASLVRLGLVNASIGSDIGGSVRIPALFCGVVALKPTALRLSLDVLG